MEEIKNEIITEQEKKYLPEVAGEALNWVESHGQEVAIGTLSLMFLIMAGSYVNLNRKKNVLAYYAIYLKNQVGCLQTSNSELRRELYSLAGDATRCGSSAGGQVLYAARNYKAPVSS